MIEGSYRSWDLYTTGQLVDGLQQKKKKKKKRKPVFIKRKWNHVIFSRATILSFHPVYKYIYMDEYVWVSLWVNGWVTKEGILSPASLKRRRCPEEFSLSILTQRPHKELCPRKSARPEEKDEERRSVRSGTLEQSVKTETLGRSVGSETPKLGVGKLGWWPDESTF